MTILLLVLAVVFILGPLYIAVLIAVKDPSEMANVLSFPKKLRLQNFVDAWVMTDYPRKFMNTLFITVINLVFTIHIGGGAVGTVAVFCQNRYSGKCLPGVIIYNTCDIDLCVQVERTHA